MRKLLLILIFSVAIFAQAQEDNQLIPGEALRVNLSADAPIQLFFTADEAQTITLTAQAIESENTPDAVLWIVDSENHLLAFNDNLGENNNPRIENLYLAQAGIYTIYVDSFNGVSEGEVEVLIEQSNRFNEQIVSDESGIQIIASLPEHSLYTYEVELQADAVVMITAQDTSGVFDPYLRILDSENNALVANDDHNSADIDLDIFDARISNWIVPADGLYQIEVRDFLGRSGEFVLSIEFISD